MLQHLFRYLRATGQASGSHAAREVPLHDAILDGILGAARHFGKVDLPFRSTADPASDTGPGRLEALRSGNPSLSRFYNADVASLHRVLRPTLPVGQRQLLGRSVYFDPGSAARFHLRAAPVALQRT